MTIRQIYFITAVFFIALLQPIVLRSQNLKNIIDPIKSHLKILEKENNLSGVVLIAKDGKPIYREAFGFSNLPDRVKNKPDTKFNLASINKMFTAIAIMQLVESGKISIQDKVGQYLTDYPNKTVADSVTIHHLLTHTSGMHSFWEDYDKLSKVNFKTVADYLPLFVDKKLAFAPGSDFYYSNSGYMVLGLIIEKLSGQKYFDYIQEHVYQPAKMINTDAYELDHAIPNLATGYTMSLEEPGQWKNNIYSNLAKGTPAGGGYSTADDLLNFANALQNNILLNKESVTLCTSGKVKYREGMYGYGFEENKINGQRIFGHTGGHDGIACELMIYPDLGYTVAILTNGEVENYWEASNLIKKQLVGSSPSIDNFFYTKNIIKTISNKGYEAGIKEIEQNSEKYSLRENLIERYGCKFLFEKKTNQAIDLFKLNIHLFPNSTNGYYYISEAYRFSGQKKQAIEYLKLYIEKEPEDQNAQIKYKLLIK
ncbi:D-alanyl-D-alanine carboxypeptidase [Chryseobacterium sp. BIGb0186]|nr:D-alanyl-D-alanine carboxypeptidase [Chryseobacterium sp. BIGb0186]